MFTLQKNLPDKGRYQVDSELRQVKLRFDQLLKDNFINRKRFVVVCGPCSADDKAPMTEFLRKLKDAQTSYPELLIVARIYTSKPHSNGQGFKGAAFQKNILDGVDLEQGITRARNIMTECLKIGLPVADELLYPELYGYFADLVSYWFVGARSSEDALHRSFASGLDVCCGVKNGTDGDVLKVVDSLQAISQPRQFPYNGSQIATNGAKYSHIVLRGGKRSNDYCSNITQEQTRQTKETLRRLDLNDFIMADLSHANSGKIAAKQVENARLVADNPDVNGVMMESYLFDGVADDSYGVSKTDECLNFEDTLCALDILKNGFVRQSD